jgi:hypothetical protein
MFVLPALVFWAARRGTGGRRISARLLVFGTLVVVGVFFLHGRAIQPLAGEHAAPFSNFSWALYGLASGGNSWSYVFEVHPELKELVEPEQSGRVYRLALELMLRDPARTLEGALSYWKAFLSGTWYGIFSFVSGVSAVPPGPVRWILYALSLTGFFGWYADRSDIFAGLACAGALGVLASVPFVPPTDAYRARMRNDSVSPPANGWLGMGRTG